jgi:predicted nucleic acid-binding protein
MATYLLDTSVIIDALLGKRGRDALLQELLQQGHLLGCCPINVAEIYAGMRPQEEAPTTEFLRSLHYYEISWEVARKAGLLKGEYARRGLTLTLADVLIAATALTYRLPLLTDNVRHFPMKDLELYPLPIVTVHPAGRKQRKLHESP